MTTISTCVPPNRVDTSQTASVKVTPSPRSPPSSQPRSRTIGAQDGETRHETGQRHRERQEKGRKNPLDFSASHFLNALFKCCHQSRHHHLSAPVTNRRLSLASRHPAFHSTRPAPATSESLNQPRRNCHSISSPGTSPPPPPPDSARKQKVEADFADADARHIPTGPTARNLGTHSIRNRTAHIFIPSQLNRRQRLIHRDWILPLHKSNHRVPTTFPIQPHSRFNKFPNFPSLPSSGPTRLPSLPSSPITSHHLSVSLPLHDAHCATSVYIFHAICPPTIIPRQPPRYRQGPARTTAASKHE
ncbi:hypothetical protein K402DRAFT_18913 [Aulographum hederae CBS 113979]|uniref:Uncharacterized protein n=1 Tax=Aulographum hederae CBS 113979 TaxID=1176131 RepID=A0A6G1H688_9PEZI|nr:hypothetical protein K402DRAFT_18913 [Aulographum hederae CBS 113979]